MDVDGYIERSRDYLEKNGFFGEGNCGRRTEQFGQIAQVWSTYESRHSADDPEPFMAGSTASQLLYDGTAAGGIVTVYWQHESAEAPIPEMYLEKYWQLTATTAHSFLRRRVSFRQTWEMESQPEDVPILLPFLNLIHRKPPMMNETKTRNCCA